jgi:pimeloyl-ACP methyl ester carboxylesterase
MARYIKFAALALSGSAAFAQDDGSQAPPPAIGDAALLAAIGSNLDADERFGKHAGAPLDQYRFASAGQIVVDLPVTRVFTREDPVDTDWSQLIYRAELVIRAFDVDAFPCETFCCESDFVTLNGQSLGQLEGKDGEWSTTRFELPPSLFQIGAVQTATFNGIGFAPTPGINQVVIDVDSNCGNQWGVLIDSVELQIEALRPTLLVHGLEDPGAVFSAFSQNFPGRLTALDEPIAITASQSRAERAIAAASDADAARTSFGVTKLNVLGHSNGALIAHDLAFLAGTTIAQVVALGGLFEGTELFDHFAIEHPLLQLADLDDADFGTVLRERVYHGLPRQRHGIDFHFATGNVFSELACPFAASHFKADHPPIVFEGENDAVVPVDRAAPPWAKEGALERFPVTHGQLLSDSAVREWVIETLRAADLARQQVGANPPHGDGGDDDAEFPQYAPVSSGEPVAVATNVFIAANSTMNIDFIVDPSVKRLHAIALGPGVQMTLRDPSNVVLASTALLGASPGGPSLGREVVVDKPQVGVWVAKLTANTSIGARFVAQLKSKIDLDLAVDAAEVEFGASQTVTAKLMKGKAAQPIDFIQGHVFDATNAQVAALDFAPSATNEHVAVWTPPALGRFRIVVSVQGGDSTQGAGAFFFRAASLDVAAIAPPTNVVAVDAETPLDLDADGFIDALRFAVSYQLAAADLHLIALALAAADGTIVGERTVFVPAVAGAGVVQLDILGESLRRAGLDGPYTVASLRVSHFASERLVAEGSLGAAHVTAAYDAMDFDGALAEVRAAEYSANGAALVVPVSLDLATGFGDTYRVTAELRSLQDDLAASAVVQTLALDPGATNLTLVFPKSALEASGESGPFVVRNLTLEPVADPSRRYVRATLLAIPALATDFTLDAGKIVRKLNKTGADSFDLEGKFETTTGVVIGAQPFRVRVGSFVQEIEASAFEADATSATFTAAAGSKGIKSVTLELLGGSTIGFRVRGKKADLAGLASPVALEIGIGDDSALGTFPFAATTAGTKLTLVSE